jgi:oxygen-independent coproporphyrinogen-3 oxidase
MSTPNNSISSSDVPDPSTASAKTEVGSYFVANYPPFSAWNRESLPAIWQALHSAPRDVPLGLYLHIPFCRKRCKFCYFRVYTDQRAEEIETYLAALAREIELISRLPCLGPRPVRFVYFGGGTPSFLSVKQLNSLFDRLKQHLRWDLAEEVTFECEPGTLSHAKVQALRQLGITRLSLGIENFNDRILEENGRAHLSQEIERSWDWIRMAQFPNVNVDLIAGMVGETWENWRDCIAKTLALEPESVTIYQMELPFNTVYSRDILKGHSQSPVADWSTKREWVSYAFDEFLARGYGISSAYTLVKHPDRMHFSYRDNLWQGADLLATGVASFGHLSGVHYQNHAEWSGYTESLQGGALPLARALRISPRQTLIREMVLQLKKGYLRSADFRAKFAVDILQEWRATWDELRRNGLLEDRPGELRLTRSGLLRVDALLPAFFEAEFRGVRYT